MPYIPSRCVANTSGNGCYWRIEASDGARENRKESLRSRGYILSKDLQEMIEKLEEKMDAHQHQIPGDLNDIRVSVEELENINTDNRLTMLEERMVNHTHPLHPNSTGKQK